MDTGSRDAGEAAAAPCPVQDGAAPNDRACDCANSTCDPGEYCQNFSSAPCAFPQCRQQVVPQGGQTYTTYGYRGRHLNFMHCSRCDPLDETKCAECDEESVLHDGTCLENTRIFSNYYAFAALDQHGTVTAWGSWSRAAPCPLGLHGHPQHFLHILRVRRARPRRHRHGVGASDSAERALQGLTGIAAFSPRPGRSPRSKDGTVTAWGSSDTAAADMGAHGHPQHFLHIKAFAALDQTAPSRRGGTCPTAAACPPGAHGHRSIFSTRWAFAALGQGSQRHGVGELSYGGSVPSGAHGHPQHFLHRWAFAALDQTATSRRGDSSRAAPCPRGLTGIRSIFSTSSAFAAHDQGGNVTAWGSLGGGVPSGAHGHHNIFSTAWAFRARPRRHRHGAWGSNYGGTVPSGAPGHPQHFLHRLGVRRARPRRQRHGVGVSDWGGSVPSGGSGHPRHFLHRQAFARSTTRHRHGVETLMGRASCPPGAHGHPRLESVFHGHVRGRWRLRCLPQWVRESCPERDSVQDVRLRQSRDAEASVSCRDCPLGYYAVKAQPNCTVCSADDTKTPKEKFRARIAAWERHWRRRSEC